MNFGNIGAMLKLKSSFDKFQKAHPKFTNFILTVKNHGIKENTVINIDLSYEDGTKIAGNLKITADDLKLFEELKGLKP